MGCFNPVPTYANLPFAGIQIAKSEGDGYNITIDWYRAYSQRLDYNVAYNIYYSTNRDDVFSEGIKFVITNPLQLSATIPDLIPGDVYYFSVRGTSFPINDVNLSQLPVVNGLAMYPEGMLLQDISETDTIIPVSDVETFPSYGLLLIGAEIIGYSSVDIPGSTLISSPGQRGLFSTEARPHAIDGYDGYVNRDPLVYHFAGFEELNQSVMLEENNFNSFKYNHTSTDGYMEKDLIVMPDHDASDCLNEKFKRYDYSGYHRTRPEDYISGKCIGTYFGGEHYCADGYNGVSGPIRGLTFNDHNSQREELILETTGEPMVLLKRQTSGKVSMHYNNHKESTTYRGIDNHGTEMVIGYEQFRNVRRSDGRIMVRFDPTKEDIKREEMGLENDFVPNGWTLPYPMLDDGDVLIRFNRDGTEEFRYEIINITRNKTLLNNDGRQVFTAVRVRKTDPIVQFRAVYDTSLIPQEVTTSIGMVTGSIPPHIHRVVISSDTITSIEQINQTTNVVQGHSHPVINGIICPTLGHDHLLILP